MIRQMPSRSCTVVGTSLHGHNYTCIGCPAGRATTYVCICARIAETKGCNKVKKTFSIFTTCAELWRIQIMADPLILQIYHTLRLAEPGRLT